MLSRKMYEVFVCRNTENKPFSSIAPAIRLNERRDHSRARGVRPWALSKLQATVHCPAAFARNYSDISKPTSNSRPVLTGVPVLKDWPGMVRCTRTFQPNHREVEELDIHDVGNANLTCAHAVGHRF